MLAWAQLPPERAPQGPPPPSQLPVDSGKRVVPSPAAFEAANDDKSTFNQQSNEKPIVTITTTRVIAPTTVFDPDSQKYVTGLKDRDFKVFDNGKPQRIEAEMIEQPISVVLAVQANAEVEELLPKLQKSAPLLHGFIAGVSGDVAILAFDHRMRLLQDFTSNPDKLNDAMQRLRAGSNSSAIIDAVLEGDRMLRQRDREGNRRRVIILISRDINKGSEARLPKTIHDVQFDSLTVYCVDISKSLRSTKDPGNPRPPHGDVPLEGRPAPIAGDGINTMSSYSEQRYTGNALRLFSPPVQSMHDLMQNPPPARAFTYFTGGKVYDFATDRGLEKAVADIGQDIRSQYVLSYAVNDDIKSEPGFHKIVVKVDRPGLEIRTRPGYWWGGQIE